MKHLKLTFLLTMLMSMVGATAFAHEIEVQNADGVTIYYDNLGEYNLAVSYRGSGPSEYTNEYSGNVVIPESVTYNGETYSVTSIGDGAFEECTSLTSITIPNSVTSIGEWAFYGCSGLEKAVVKDIAAWCKIQFGEYGESNPLYYAKHLYRDDNTEITNLVIPESVTSIGEWAFYGCSGLTSITIPNSVTSIGDVTFSECTGLTSITIPNSVTSIGSYAFEECTSLTSVTIPNSVTSIGDCAFLGCSGLTAITIPESVTSIGGGAFGDCSGLEKAVVKDIAAWCKIQFYDGESNPLYYAKHLYRDDNTEITNLVIPESVTSIGDCAFYGCSGLSSITIPNSVTSIGRSAFSDCSGLTAITIPNSVTSIGSLSFSNCTGLTSITIPNSVTSIGSYAFNGTAWYNNQPDGLVYAGKVAYKYKGTMPANTSIELEEGTLGIADEAFHVCRRLTSVTIPESVTSIGAAAFLCCSGLTSVTIPNSVTSIGDGAFEECTSLTSVTVMNPTPVFITDYTFDNKNATLYVPAGSKAAYEAAYYWKEFFKEIVEIDPRTEQTLALSEIPTLTVGDAPYNLPATTHEGLALNWSVGDNTIAEITEGKLSAKAVGETTVTATQAGNDEYLPFTRDFTLTVNEAEQPQGVDVTDISQLDNVIFIAPFTATAGTKTAISIEMKNTAAIRGFQFDLYLPEGMTVVKSAKGKIQGTLSAGRLPDEDEHDLTFSQQSDGAIRFLCSSQYDETFTGNSGELATLQVEIANDMTNGDHAIQLKNIKLTETDISKNYTTDLIESKVTIEGGATEKNELVLTNNADNSAAISNAAESGKVYDVTLQDRTLRKNGTWHTLCLPFNMTEEQIAANTDFAGATLMMLDVMQQNGFDPTVGTLYLRFKPSTEIEAGVPYLVKWEKAADYDANPSAYDIVNPVFSDVTISNAEAQTIEGDTDGLLEKVQMVGVYSPFSITANDKSILYMGGANKLYYSTVDQQIGSCRAFFSVPYIKGNVGARVSAITLLFDDDVATGISIIPAPSTKGDGNSCWYTIEGCKLSGKPTQRGLYIKNGRKLVIK